MQILRVSAAGLSILCLAGCGDLFKGMYTNPPSLLAEALAPNPPTPVAAGDKSSQGSVDDPTKFLEEKREALRKVLYRISNKQENYIRIVRRTRLSEDMFSLPIIGAAVGAGVALMNSAPVSTIGGFGIAGGALSYTQSYFNLDNRVDSTMRAVLGLNCLGQQAIPLLAADAVFLNTAKKKLETEIDEARKAALLPGLAEKTSKELSDRLSVANLTARAVNAELELYFTSDFFIANAADNIEIYVQSARRRDSVNFETAFTAIQAARDKVALVEAVKASPSGTKEASADGTPKVKSGDGTPQALSLDQVTELIKKAMDSDPRNKTLAMVNDVVNGKPATNSQNDELAKIKITKLNYAIEQAKLSIPTPSIATSHEEMVKCTAFASAK